MSTIQKCPSCRREYVEARMACPHCGHTSWGAIGMMIMLTLMCLGVAIFASPYVGSPVWRVVVRWGTGGIGALFLLITICMVHEVRQPNLRRMREKRDVASLINVLYVHDKYLRQAAAEALGQVGDSRALKPLKTALKDKDEGTRKAAAKALGQLKDNQAIEPLMATLKDQDESVRKAAAGALGQVGDARVVEPLVATLKDERSGVREAAARALGQFRDAQPMEALVAALQDRDEGVRKVAAEALGQIGNVLTVEPLVAALRDNSGAVRQKAMEALVRIGTSAVNPLAAILTDQDSEVRRLAVEALGQIGDGRAVEPLVRALQDVCVRETAAKALEKLGDVALVPLTAALRDPDSGVQQAAAKALVALGHDLLPPKWPQYSTELVGYNPIRINNPNEFKVRVGLRSGSRGKDIMVSAHGTGSASMPNGSYSIYFQYSTDPFGLYQGDSFTLNDNGVEIKLVKVAGGNYGIRKVG